MAHSCRLSHTLYRKQISGEPIIALLLLFHRLHGRKIGDVYPGSYEQEFINRGWYTAKYFRTFPLLPW